MERALKARLGAARIALDGQAGRPCHASISRVQAAAVGDLLRRTTMNPEARAEAADSLLDMK